jgi:hypothetical protein
VKQDKALALFLLGLFVPPSTLAAGAEEIQPRLLAALKEATCAANRLHPVFVGAKEIRESFLPKELSGYRFFEVTCAPKRKDLGNARPIVPEGPDGKLWMPKDFDGLFKDAKVHVESEQTAIVLARTLIWLRREMPISSVEEIRGIEKQPGIKLELAPVIRPIFAVKSGDLFEVTFYLWRYGNVERYTMAISADASVVRAHNQVIRSMVGDFRGKG